MQKPDRKEKTGRVGQKKKGSIYICSSFCSKKCCHNSGLSLLSHLILRCNICEAQVTSPTKNMWQQNEALTSINRLAKRESTCASPVIGIRPDDLVPLCLKSCWDFFLKKSSLFFLLCSGVLIVTIKTSFTALTAKCK